jgi:hypothetical protein
MTFPSEIHALRQGTLRAYSFQERSEERAQTALYHGKARDLVKTYLNDLEIGLQDDAFPITSGIFRRIIHDLAVVWRAPPSRFLTRRGQPLADDSVAQVIFDESYQDAGVNDILRKADRLRCLWRNCFIRLYPSDARRTVRAVTYPPSAVYRGETVPEPEDIRGDERFYIERSDKRIEYFTKETNGWRYELFDTNGFVTFSDFFEHLPVISLFDGIPDAPYLHPFEFRTEYAMKYVLCISQVSAAVIYDVNARATVETPFPPAGTSSIMAPPSGMKTVEVGPGAVTALDLGETLKIHTLQPQIAAILSASDGILRAWLRDESLPDESFRTSQNITAQGLRVLSQPLFERREDLLNASVRAEVALFEAFRAMHNRYAMQWGKPWIAEGLRLDVSMAEIDMPTTANEKVDLLSRELRVGFISPVEAIQARHGISRREALSRIARTRLDQAEHALLGSPGADAGIVGARPAVPGGDDATATGDAAKAMGNE